MCQCNARAASRMAVDEFKARVVSTAIRLRSLLIVPSVKIDGLSGGGVYLLIYMQWRSGGVNNIPQGDTATVTLYYVRY